MLGVFRSAEAGPRSAVARIGLVALLACIGLTWTAGASSAFATYGTVTVKKVNEGGDPADVFHFDASRAIDTDGTFDLEGGQYRTSSTVHANTGSYSSRGDYYVTERSDDKYDLKSVDCTVDGGYDRTASYGSTTPYGNGVKVRVGVHHTVYCTFTNKRKTGTIIVKKQLAPSTDAGHFDLKVDDDAVATKVGDGGYGSKTVATGSHKVGEAAAYGTDLGDYTAYTTCTKPNGYVVAQGSGAQYVDVAKDDTITCAITNVRKAKIVVAKHTAPADTAAVKTAFQFSISPGAIAYTLTDGASDTRTVEANKAYTITEADPRATGYRLTGIECSTGTQDLQTGTATVAPGPGETVYCSYTNTELQAAIDIDKSGPATATAGDLLRYTLAVTNPGETTFAAADVVVTDPRCDAAPVLDSTNGDLTPAVLNTGDKWTYTCAVQSAVGNTSVVNAADVKGTDENGQVVTDEDTVTTTLTQPTPPSTPQPPSSPQPQPQAQPAPAQAVAGTKVVSRPARGTAAFRGPRACPRTTRVSASVTGRQIRRVTFSVRGHKVQTVTKVGKNGRWTLSLRTSSLRRGTNAVVAHVEFTSASQTKARRLRINITRCASAVRPQFTG